MGQESPSRRTSLKYDSLENILSKALNSCQNIYRNEPSLVFTRMPGLQWKSAWPLGVAAPVSIAREQAHRSPSPRCCQLWWRQTGLFSTAGLLELGQNLVKLGVRLGCQGDCLGLEDECFHWFSWEGGRRAPGLAKYHSLTKIA